MIKPRNKQITKSIGLKIKQAREACGFSQTKLSSFCGVSYQQIHKYENGTNQVTCSRLWQISKATNKPICWFFPKR